MNKNYLIFFKFGLKYMGNIIVIVIHLLVLHANNYSKNYILVSNKKTIILNAVSVVASWMKNN